MFDLLTFGIYNIPANYFMARHTVDHFTVRYSWRAENLIDSSLFLFFWFLVSVHIRFNNRIDYFSYGDVFLPFSIFGTINARYFLCYYCVRELLIRFRNRSKLLFGLFNVSLYFYFCFSWNFVQFFFGDSIKLNWF